LLFSPIESRGRKEGKGATLDMEILNGQVGGQAPPTRSGTIEKIEMAHNFFDICTTDKEDLGRTRQILKCNLQECKPRKRECAVVLFVCSDHDSPVCLSNLLLAFVYIYVFS
jgi:hypothetical protein